MSCVPKGWIGGTMKFSIDDRFASVSRLEASIAQQERVLAELKRLDEPTALAEKFLERLKEALESRRRQPLA